MNSFDIKTVTEGALTSALSLGMSHDNAEEFTKVVIMAAAAANLGMHCAVERANKILRMLLTRNHQDVHNCILPSQRISAGLSEEAQQALLAESWLLAAKLAD